MCDVNHYWGISGEEGFRVYKVGPDGQLKDLPMPYRIIGRHAFPFEWGNGGKGEWMLAVALLASAHSEWAATYLASEFRSQVIANLPGEWYMDTEQIQRWVQTVRHNIAARANGGH